MPPPQAPVLLPISAMKLNVGRFGEPLHGRLQTGNVVLNSNED
jgi:hypothetical protein